MVLPLLIVTVNVAAYHSYLSTPHAWPVILASDGEHCAS
jgi:hypothetical protein